MKNDDINDYLPSILNPRAIKKRNGDITLTQNSVVSHCSLSLKRKSSFLNVKKNLCKQFPFDKENIHANENDSLTQETVHNEYTPKNKVRQEGNSNFSTVADFNWGSERFQGHQGKENNQNNHKVTITKNLHKDIEGGSLDFSALEGLNTVRNNGIHSSIPSFGDIECPVRDDGKISDQICDNEINDENISLISVSSATDLTVENKLENSNSTVSYEINYKPLVISVLCGVNNCDTVNVSTKNSNIKNIVVSHNHIDNKMSVDCKILENSSHISILSSDEEMNEEDLPSPPKRAAVTVNLEIKRNKTSEENSKVLILNTNAIEKLSHVIIQPPNYKIVKRKFLDTNKFKISAEKEKVLSAQLKQKRIDSFLIKSADVIKVSDILSGKTKNVVCNDGQDMSKNSGVADAVKDRNGKALSKGLRKENEASPRSIKVVPRREASPKQQGLKLSSSEAPRAAPRSRNDSASSARSPRKNIESVQFNLPKSRSNRNSQSPRCIPHFKIVAGTHFAVDAFSYGDIPNVKHYFLTHFHSDHYAGLKKGFNKLLFCSKITADLCISRLGVNAKSIHVINCDETLTIEGVEITAVDANHCPGALMLVFTLPNGKSLLHTGDFRASPLMESYPVFWNKDIHSIYLDTTYCNPRYDFPTQDQSLEMALYHLRQKKLDLEKSGKKFSSVLIVCGTYTIGKEKFFLGMARRVGCSVWACPEKDRVLQAVEGRSFSHAPAPSCQLHVVPMRDLTHEKLRSYLDSLQGAFSEVVAFKPSGWENGKNSTTQKNLVTIHGIPYSEHSSFSELIRFVKYLKPKQVVPTVDISGGVKSVQKYFPCPLVCKEELQSQSKLTDYFNIHQRHPTPPVT